MMPALPPIVGLPLIVAPAELRLARFLAYRAALLAGAIGRDTPIITDGIAAGPGAQGTAATTMLQGQAGTAGVRGALPMSLPSIVTG